MAQPQALNSEQPVYFDVVNVYMDLLILIWFSTDRGHLHFKLKSLIGCEVFSIWQIDCKVIVAYSQ